MLPDLEKLRRDGGCDHRRVLVRDAGKPDGADQGPDPRLIQAQLPEALLEARPLRVAADETHIGEARPQQSRPRGPACGRPWPPAGYGTERRPPGCRASGPRTAGARAPEPGRAP